MIFHFPKKREKQLHQLFRESLAKAYQLSALPTRLGLSEELEVEVQTPPKNFPQALSSPVAFQLSSESKQGISPAEIAESLIHQVGSNEFELSLEGKGFINANPKIEIVNKVLSAWANNQAQEMGSLPQVSSVQVSLEKSGALDSSEFLSVVESLGRADFDCSLIGLAITASSDFSYEAFVEDVGSSENLPWYFNYFFSKTKQLDCREPLTEEVDLDELMIKVLSLSNASNKLSCAEFVLYLRDLVHLFFKAYNHPNKRGKFNQPGYGLLAVAARSQVAWGLEVLKERVHW